MVPLAGGEATADAIPTAELKIIKGRGHVMPDLETYGPDILDGMLNHAQDLFMIPVSF